MTENLWHRISHDPQVTFISHSSSSKFHPRITSITSFHSLHYLSQLSPQQVASSGFVRRRHCTKLRGKVVRLLSLSLYSLSCGYSVARLLYGLLSYFLNFHPNKVASSGFVRRRHCTVLGGKVGR